MDVLMPQLGETVLEGTVASWYKKVGDTVAKGDLLLDVETDKAATEIEAPADGVLSSINVPEGDTVDVGTVLAVIAGEGEDAAADAEPVAEEQAAAEPESAPKGLPAKSTSNKLSPAVRRLVREHDLDISAIQGTGRDGRTTKRDVETYLRDGGGSTAAAPAAAPVAARAAAPTSGVIPFDRYRRVTADHMVQSLATSPHVLQAIDADFSAVDNCRLRKKDKWKRDHGYSLTYLPFVARAICKALAEFPRLNASVVGDALHLHANINLAIAIDLNHEGLVAPVVADAGSLSVSGLAKRFNDLVVRAKSRKLSADVMQGGTYTLSNPGPYGTVFTASIINQPQVGIVSMDAIKKRPVVIESAAGDSIAIRPVGMLSHSFDHRAVDGAYSAAYLQRLKSLIEDTDWSNEF